MFRSDWTYPSDLFVKGQGTKKLNESLDARRACEKKGRGCQQEAAAFRVISGLSYKEGTLGKKSRVFASKQGSHFGLNRNEERKYVPLIDLNQLFFPRFLLRTLYLQSDGLCILLFLCFRLSFCLQP